jgi:hypothetical protein
MKTKQVTVKTYRKTSTVGVEMFDGISELDKYLLGRKTKSGWEGSDVKRMCKTQSDWVGVSSYDELHSLMSSGYEGAELTEFEHEIKSIKGSGKRICFENDIIGFAPVVPLAIIGVPNNMINSRIKPIKTKVINLYFERGASCGVNANEIKESGKQMLGAIIKAEQAGYRINLFVTHTTTNNTGKDGILCVKVKDSNTPINIKRMAFAIVHPAFIRGAAFEWFEKTNCCEYIAGYGKGAGYNYYYKPNEVEDIYKQVLDKNGIFISSQTKATEISSNILDKLAQ